MSFLKDRSLSIRVQRDPKTSPPAGEETSTIENVQAIASIVDETAASVAVTVVKSAAIIIGLGTAAKILTTLAHNLTK